MSENIKAIFLRDSTRFEGGPFVEGEVVNLSAASWDYWNQRGAVAVAPARAKLGKPLPKDPEDAEDPTEVPAED